jgi:hypothetical protein
MAKKKESFFWTSYSDLMTSLFFIMMVLFVLVMVLLYKRMQVTENKLEEIKRVEQSTKDLSKDYFEYNEQYEKYVLKIDVFFPELMTEFSNLTPGCCDSLKNAGTEIVRFLDTHKSNKYLLIIEGQASRNSEKWMDRNYNLSFLRAENLMKFWLTDCGLNFPGNVEVQIAGSGDGRLNINSMRDPINSKNQRFLIHIIPKNIFKE